MRVLFLSRADAFDGKSSLVNIATSKFAHMLAQDPELFVTWVIPAGTKDEAFAAAVLDRMPDPKRMRPLKVTAGLSGRTLGYFLTQELWYELTQTKTTVPYDVVLSNQMALTPVYQVVLANRYRASAFHVPVAFVNWQMWTATLRQLEEVPEYYAGEVDVFAESVSSLYATNVWESEILYASHADGRDVPRVGGGRCSSVGCCRRRAGVTCAEQQWSSSSRHARLAPLA